MTGPSNPKKKRLMPEETNRLLLVPLAEPPIANAYHHWNEETRTLIYTYNGHKIISIKIPGKSQVSFRHSSDGTLQSWPLLQQVYVIVQEEVTGTVTFELSRDVVNMRPRRAPSEHAIVGNVGRPLMPGVNGLYDVHQDFMLAWHGHEWKWISERLAPDTEGNLTAQMEVKLGPATWVIVIKPHYYRTHLGYIYHKPWERRPKTKSVVGWCTWEAYRRDLSEEKIVDAAKFFAKHLKPYGMEYVQIDDGFEKLPLPLNPHGTLVEAWLEPKDTFPGGHKSVVEKIRATGMTPGIWTSTAVYNDDFADAQPECLVRDKNGKPILGDWVRYVLDCKPESLEKHVRPVYKGLREYGYEYFKIDVIRHTLFDGLHEAVMLGLMTNDDAEKRYRALLECAREGLGDEVFWLSSWGQMSQMVGLCDACRISQDAMPNWDGMQMQLVESARWFFTQRILYINDPDHVCVRAPFEWSRSVLSMVSLTGGLFMLSDALKEYDEKRIDLIKRCIPTLTTVAGETGPLEADYAAYTWTKLHGFAVLNEEPFKPEDVTDEEARAMAGNWPTKDDNHPFSSLWAIHIDKAPGCWCVMARFATLPLEPSRLSVESLSLDPEKEYLAFDFWKNKYLGVVSGGIDLPALKLGHCQIVSFREALGRPQFLSSTRHVSMDAVSVKEQTWKGNELTLVIEGVAGTTETYWVHVPKGFEVKEVKAEGSTALKGDPVPDRKGGKALPIDLAFVDGREEVVRSVLRIHF